MEAYQTYVIEKIDQKCFVQHARMIITMVYLGRSRSEITAGFPGIMQGPVIVDWFRGVAAINDICERLLQTRTSVTSRQIIEIPYKLAHSKLSQPPISIDDIDLSGTERERVVSILLLIWCLLTRNSL